MVAAHARSQEMTLVTNNDKHFRRVPVLKIENWTKWVSNEKKPGHAGSLRPGLPDVKAKEKIGLDKAAKWYLEQ